MAGHYAAGSGGDGCAEGNEFQTFEARAVGVNYWEIEMRVGGSVSVAGEMFGGSQGAIFFRAAHEGCYKFGDFSWIFAE